MTWRTVGLTNGEQPLVDVNFHARAKNRVLDIYRKTF